MKKGKHNRILISYGDSRFIESLKRLARKAPKSGLFDKVIVYTPKDLPLSILSSPLYAYEKGGGYWVWKPYIIRHTLSLCDEGDTIYYIDAGCTINPLSEEWILFQKQMENHNAIFFQYRENVKYAGWERFCTLEEYNSAKIKHWIKPSTRYFFNEYFRDESYLDFGKIWAGCCIVKKTKNPLSTIEEWFNITMFHPEYVMDPFGCDLSRLPESFNAHRHDQSIITPLVYYYGKEDNILVLPETAESNPGKAAVVASRYKLGHLPFLQYLKYRIYNMIYRD